MKTFNNSNFYLILIIYWLLAGCLSPTKRDPSVNALETKDTASFYMTEIKNIKVTKTHTIRDWAIPIAKKYSFFTCLKETLTEVSIPHQPFTIKMGGQQTSATTDGSGCLSWTQEVSYNFLADSKYLLMEGSLQSRGILKGQRSFKIALNPWSSDRGTSVPEMVDLSTSTAIPDGSLISDEKEIDKALKGIKDNGEVVTRSLWVPNLTYEGVQGGRSSKGVETSIQLSIKPFMALNDLYGANYTYPLKNSLFDVSMQLVAVTIEDDRHVRIPLSKPLIKKEAHLDNDQLYVKFSTLLENQVHDGNLELVLRLIPKNAPAGLNTFEGVYRLGSVRDIFKKYTAQLQNKLEKTVSSPEIKSNTDILNHYKYKNDSFKLTELKISFKDIKWQTATKRRLGFSVKTRVLDGFDARIIRGEDFTIRTKKNNPESGEPSDKDSKIITKTTQNQGELAWTDEIEHKYYSPERYIKKTFILEHKSGYKKEYHFYINPWDRAWTFGTDARIYSKDDLLKIQQRAKNAIKPRLMIPRYTIQTLDFSYTVDKFLTLEINKRFQLQIEPRVIRDTLTRGSNTGEPLRDGVYLLRMAVKKSYFEVTGKEERDFISPVQKLITVKNGLITTPIILTVRDMRLMRIRSFIFIELETVDLEKINASEELKNDNKVSRNYSVEDLKKYNAYDFNSIVDKNSGLPRRTFVGPLIMLPNSFSAAMRPTDDLESSSCKVADCNQLTTVGFSPTDVIKIPASKMYTLSNNSVSGFQLNSTFKNLTVGELIDQWSKIEKQYLKNMENASSLETFLAKNDLEVIRLSKNSSSSSFLDKFTPELQEKTNKVFTKGYYLNNLVSVLNKSNRLVRDDALKRDFHRLGIQGDDKINVYDIFKIFESNQMSPLLALRMCHLFFDKIINYPNKDGIQLLDKEISKNDFHDSMRGFASSIIGRPMTSRKSKKHSNSFSYVFIEKCSETLLEGLKKPLSNWKDVLDTTKTHQNSADWSSEDIPFPFIIDKKLRIKKVRNAIESSGFAMNFSVNMGFTESSGNSKTNSVSGYLSPTAWMKGLLADLVAGFKFSINSIRSLFKSRISSATANSSVYLSTQMKQILLNFSEYETCVIIRINPEFLSWDRARFFNGSLNLDYIINKNYPQEEAVKRFARGLLICTGETIKDKSDSSNSQYFRETYYYTTQHFTEGDILDVFHLMNHPWLLSLRGVNTFSTFIKSFDSRRVVWDSGAKTWRTHNLQDQPEAYALGYPIDRLSLAYATHLPSSPGFYTILPQEIIYAQNIQKKPKANEEKLLHQENSDRWLINNVLKSLVDY